MKLFADCIHHLDVKVDAERVTAAKPVQVVEKTVRAAAHIEHMRLRCNPADVLLELADPLQCESARQPAHSRRFPAAPQYRAVAEVFGRIEPCEARRSRA